MVSTSGGFNARPVTAGEAGVAAGLVRPCRKSRISIGGAERWAPGSPSRNTAGGFDQGQEQLSPYAPKTLVAIMWSSFDVGPLRTGAFFFRVAVVLRRLLLGFCSDCCCRVRLSFCVFVALRRSCELRIAVLLFECNLPARQKSSSSNTASLSTETGEEGLFREIGCERGVRGGLVYDSVP